MKQLYTFITHYNGNESAEQVLSPDIDSAIKAWQDREFIRQITLPVKDEFRAEIDWLISEKDYVALDENINVWYFSILLADELLTVHIVQTGIGQRVEKEDDIPGMASGDQRRKHKSK